MPTPRNRKLVQTTDVAYEHLLKLRDAQSKAMGYSSLSITNYISNLILSTPIPNGNGNTPSVAIPAVNVDAGSTSPSEEEKPCID